jgi:UDP-N-acetylmuramoyl-L-alanyl-D-glutamate--2,6-diaminopimelate ligase
MANGKIKNSMIQRIKNKGHLVNALLANTYYQFPARSLKIIGVTGTDGKTTTTHMIYHILENAHKNVSMISSVYAKVGGKEYSLGFHVSTPDPWFLQKMLRKAVIAGDEYFVIETTSHALDQNRTWGIPFTVGVLTNISHEHLDYHRTFDSYIRAKMKLITHSRIAVLNREDASYEHIITLQGNRKNVVTYGLKTGDNIWKNSQLEISLPGEYNKYNALAAFTVCHSLSIPKDIICKALESFQGVTGRFEKIITNKGITVIIDFAHTPNGLKQVLSTVRKETKGRIIHLFGCAGLRDYTKRPIMGKISSQLADITVLTEEDYRTENFDTIIMQIKKGMKRKQNVFVYKFRQDAINYATSIAHPDDVVLLTGKGHEKSLCRGKTEYPWDEHKAVEKAT